MKIKTHSDLIKAVGKRSPSGARWMMEDAEIVYTSYNSEDINYVEGIYLTTSFLWHNTPQGSEFWGIIDSKIYESWEYYYD